MVSLHVLSRPEHHTKRLTWAEEMRLALPPELNTKLQYFRLISGDFLDILDVLEPWHAYLQTSVEAGLEHMGNLPELEFIQLLMGPKYHRSQVNAWLRGQRDEIFAQLNPEIRAMLGQPQTTKFELMKFLYAYLIYFQKEQRRVEPWLIRAVYLAQDHLRREPLQFMERVHPRFKLNDAYMEFHKAITYRFYYHELKRIYLLPSTFMAPHLWLGTYGARLTVGLQVETPMETSRMIVPTDLIQKMKGLADPTRMAILKSLLEHPYCIQQLAELHGISEAAISKHVKVLAQAELVWSERRGYYVFYQAIPSRLEMLAVDIHQFVDMPSPKERR